MSEGLPKAWVVQEDWETSLRNDGEAYPYWQRNQTEFRAAKLAWAAHQREVGGNPHHLPPPGTWHLPITELAFRPEPDAYVPDILYFGRDLALSARARAAMALPDDEAVVQVRPAVVVEGPPAAHAMDYRFVHVVAEQPAMDPVASGSTLERRRIGDRGLVVEHWVSPKRLVFRPDFALAGDLVRLSELGATLLASDALALRVLAASCTGVVFADPLTAFDWSIPTRIRTWDGTALLVP